MQHVASCFDVDELAVDVLNVAPAFRLAPQVRDPEVEAIIQRMPVFALHEVGVEAITILHLAKDNVISKDLARRRDGLVRAPTAVHDPRFKRPPRAPVSNCNARQQHPFQLDVSLLRRLSSVGQ